MVSELDTLTLGQQYASLTGPFTSVMSADCYVLDMALTFLEVLEYFVVQQAIHKPQSFSRVY